MEELQVIETTSGRQFKPWATKEDLQDPASVTAVASEIASGKQVIAEAINAKGGSASPAESFTELAQDIQDTPTSGVLSDGIVQSEPFSFLGYVCKQGAYPFTEIDDNSVTVIDRLNAFYRQTQLLKVKMTALTTISGSHVFSSCSSLQKIELPNLSTISDVYVFANCSSLQKIELPNLSTISGSHVFFNCSSLQKIELPNLSTISDIYVFANCSSLQKIELPNLSTISGSYAFSNCSSLQKIELPNLINWTNASLCCVYCSSLEEFIAPILSNYSQSYYDPFRYSTNLKNIVVGTLTNGCFNFAETRQNNLRNITIGQDTNINLPFSNWTATNVIAEGQSGIDELNSNLYNNLLTKLYDHSQDGVTRTLRIGWLSRVSAENIAYANAKGWTLTT